MLYGLSNRDKLVKARHLCPYRRLSQSLSGTNYHPNEVLSTRMGLLRTCALAIGLMLMNVRYIYVCLCIAGMIHK